MQKFVLTIRFLLFAVFFLAGTGAVVLSILAEPELVNYYHNKAMLTDIRKQNERIQSLTEQYDAQIRFIEAEPNVLERLSPLTFGHPPQAADTAFPQVQNESLRAETEQILRLLEKTDEINPVPAWLERMQQPRLRRGLFFSGAGLVLIACIFFGTNKKTAPGW